jgi:hypothetical protein
VIRSLARRGGGLCFPIQPPLIVESLILHALSAAGPIAQEGQRNMTVRSKLALGFAAGALLIVSASPAAARGPDGRWGRHHHRDHDNGGAVIGAILGVGIIAAIAASAARTREAERDGPAPRRSGEDDPRYDDPRYDGRDRDARADDDRRHGESGSADAGADAGQERAVDACALAARDEASRDGDFAEVRDITGVRPFGGDGYDVTGTIDQRSGYRARDGRLRSFRCTFANGRVEGVRFSSIA